MTQFLHKVYYLILINWTWLFGYRVVPTENTKRIYKEFGERIYTKYESIHTEKNSLRHDILVIILIVKQI